MVRELLTMEFTTVSTVKKLYDTMPSKNPKHPGKTWEMTEVTGLAASNNQRVTTWVLVDTAAGAVAPRVGEIMKFPLFKLQKGHFAWSVTGKKGNESSTIVHALADCWQSANQGTAASVSLENQAAFVAAVVSSVAAQTAAVATI